MVKNSKDTRNVRSINGDPYPRVSAIIRSLGEGGYSFFAGARERQRFLDILDQQRPIEAMGTIRAMLSSKWYFSKMQHRWLIKPLEEGVLLDLMFPEVVKDPQMTKPQFVDLANGLVEEYRLKLVDVAPVIRDARSLIPWIEENGVELVSGHQIIVGNYGDYMGYSGEADNVIILRSLDDKPRIMDLKRTACYRRPHAMQLAAYFFADHVYDPLTNELAPYNWDRDCPTPALFVYTCGMATRHRLIERHELDMAYEAFLGTLKGYLWNHVSPVPVNPMTRRHYNGKSLDYPGAMTPQAAPSSDEELDMYYESIQNHPLL